MNEQQAARVAEITKTITSLCKSLDDARARFDDVKRYVRTLENRLANTQIELTKIIALHVDRHALDQVAPDPCRVLPASD